MKKKFNLTVISALLLSGALLLPGCAASTPPSSDIEAAEQPVQINTASALPGTPVSDYTGNSSNTIIVNSSEQVTVTPDIAQVIYSVRTRAKDAAGCQTKNTEDVFNVIELLKTLGIQETSIQTSGYNMYPIYDYSGSTQRITGYEANSTLTVSDIPLQELGSILTQSVASGINSIQSVAYESSKYDEAYQEALKLAMGTALTKAQALAEAGGCTLGGVAGVQENSSYSAARYTDNSLGAQKQYAAGIFNEESAADAAIMPGQIDVEVNITVQYQIL